MRARNVDQSANKVGVPDVGHAGGSGCECAIGESDVEEQLALGRGDVAAPHGGSLDGGDPTVPARVSERFER